MKRRLALISFIVAVSLVALASSAAAQDASLNRAREAFDKGQTLFEAGNFDKAGEQFQLAYDARPFAQFLFNIGACYEKGNDYERAVDFYKRYLIDAPKAQDRSAVEKRISVLNKELERIKSKPPVDPTNPDAPVDPTNPDAPVEPSVPSAEVAALDDIAIRGLVVVESEPAQATIYLDSKKNKPLARTPWNGSLEGGHTLFIEREGYKPIEKRISPDPNKLLVLYFALAEEDYLGWIKIESNIPEADIFIDDKSVGSRQKTPWSGNIEPGKHKIWVTKEGYDEYSVEIDVVRGQTHEVKATLSGNPVGYLDVRGNVENVKVYLDGKLLCSAGPCRQPVPEGPHKVTIKRSGYKPYSKRFTMQAKSEMTLIPRLAKKPGRTDAIFAYVFSAGFAVGGFFLASEAESIKDELQTDVDAGMPPPDGSDSRFNRARIFSVAGDGLYTLAGFSLAAAIYYTFRDKGPPSSAKSDVRAIALEPSLSPEYAGVTMGVTW